MTLCRPIVERRTFSDTNFQLSYFYNILLCDYCVLPLRVHGCVWQLLMKKYDDDEYRVTQKRKTLLRIIIKLH